MTRVPGYFGKVVTHGDFVQRRMPPDFIAHWDRWLQAGMFHSQLALGDAWRDAYLNSPVWRFALAPGLCGADGMAGVMVPGVDGVRRYFPLTLAAPADAAPHADWYAALEELALGSLDAGFSLAALDAGLARLGPAPVAADAAPLNGGSAFWTLRTMHGGPVCRVFRGMPAAHEFHTLLACVV